MGHRYLREMRYDQFLSWRDIGGPPSRAPGIGKEGKTLALWISPSQLYIRVKTNHHHHLFLSIIHEVCFSVNILKVFTEMLCWKCTWNIAQFITHFLLGNNVSKTIRFAHSGQPYMTITCLILEDRLYCYRPLIWIII